MRKIVIVMTLFLILTLPTTAKVKPRFVEGSGIYTRFFLFFFPIAKKYTTFFTVYGNKLLIDLKIEKKMLRNPPINDAMKPQLVVSDLTFTFIDLPIGATGEFDIPVWIRCNDKITQKYVKCKIVTNENIMVIQGQLDKLRIGEMTNNPYFKKRATWYQPYYFDVRIQL